MFVGIAPALNYGDPWVSSLADRLRQLAAQPRRIAYFYEYPDASTFRYRVFNPCLTLGAKPDCGVSGAWFSHHDLHSDDSFLDLADALVICRARYNSALARMVARCRARNIPVLFDCDDLVFDIGRVHLLVDSLDLEQSKETVWDGWYASIARIGASMRLCDAFITTNQYLAELASKHDPRLRAAILPNYLNRDQQELSQVYFRSKRDSNWARDGRIHIGYFSGSPTHARDFAIVTPAICRLLARDPRVVLRVVGFFDFGHELRRYRDRIEVYPLQGFLNLQQLIAEVEINIAPLQENAFTNCKSELKFFEAAICGTLTLATPTFSFRNSIVHGKTGFLVPSHAWDLALEDALATVEEKPHYEAIATAAFDHVQAAYGWNVHANTITRAVFGPDERQPAPR
jgi:glycosyltransferase involved in cell wall biosynthesis